MKKIKLNKACFFTVESGQCIFLNELADEYCILDKDNSNKFLLACEQNDVENNIVKELINDSILFIGENDEKDHFCQALVDQDKKKNITVADEVSKEPINIPIIIFFVFLLLEKSFRLKFFGFSNVVTLARKKKKNKRKSEKINNVNAILYNLNIAKKLCPLKIECLIFSLCLFENLIKNKNSPKLIIGVKSNPFYSHAWVEIGEFQITDKFINLSELTAIMEI